jgi:hypothetical protein
MPLSLVVAAAVSVGRGVSGIVDAANARANSSSYAASSSFTVVVVVAVLATTDGVDGVTATSTMVDCVDVAAVVVDDVVVDVASDDDFAVVIRQHIHIDQQHIDTQTYRYARTWWIVEQIREQLKAFR